MRGKSSLPNHYACGLLICLWPPVVSADGGIGSLSALVPIFVGLACLAFALFVWLVLSLNLFVTRPNKITKGKIKFYNGYSIFVLVMLLAASFVGTLLAGVLALLLFLVLTIVLAITVAISSRAQRLMQTELIAEE